jgi:hypothetical protein
VASDIMWLAVSAEEDKKAYSRVYAELQAE